VDGGLMVWMEEELAQVLVVVVVNVVVVLTWRRRKVGKVNGSLPGQWHTQMRCGMDVMLGCGEGCFCLLEEREGSGRRRGGRRRSSCSRVPL
jgi:hypothetical protein